MKLKPWVLWMGLAIGLVPLVAYLALYPQLPDYMATSFGFDGTINDYSAKSELWFLMVLPLVLLPVFYFIPRIDPKGEKYNHFRGFYQWFILGITAFVSAMSIFILVQSMTGDSQYIVKLTPILLGLMFVAMGNYMPKVKQNYTMGIKTPWTLANEVVWYKTHRLGGKCFMVAGFLCLLGAMLKNWLWLFLVVMGVAVLIPLVMSYVYYRREMEKKQ